MQRLPAPCNVYLRLRNVGPALVTFVPYATSVAYVTYTSDSRGANQARRRQRRARAGGQSSKTAAETDSLHTLPVPGGCVTWGRAPAYPPHMRYTREISTACTLHALRE